MKKNHVFALWGGMFILCAGLGFIPRQPGLFSTLLRLVGLGFFVPPVLLLCRAKKGSDRSCLLLIRNLSLASLGLTVLGLILNILFATAPLWAGELLNAMLIVLSSPMFCCGNWALSLFLWACLLMASLMALKNK